jgi:hypothetical protein
MHLEYSTIGKCKPRHVWQKFEKLEEWGWWNPVVGQTRWLEGERWQKGGRFSFQLMKPRVMNFKPVIIESAPPHRLAWVGGTPGFKGVHWFSFEEQPDGTTLLKTWEDSSGIVTLFFGAGMRNKLLAMHREWLEALKVEAEKIALEEHVRS